MTSFNDSSVFDLRVTVANASKELKDTLQQEVEWSFSLNSCARTDVMIVFAGASSLL